jgi:hypothetical protein
MNIKALLPLTLIPDVEPLKTWEDYCQNPMLMFSDFADRYAVNAEALANTLPSIKGQDVPAPSDRGKLWIKTSWPYAIAILINGVYQYDWGLSGFPAFVPFLMTEKKMGTPLKPFVRKLLAEDLEEMGLTDTETGDGDKRAVWWIFEPEEPAI